jgi:murein DD-endopeptidase MepM/ murein hydrolase activator NlpD
MLGRALSTALLWLLLLAAAAPALSTLEPVHVAQRMVVEGEIRRGESLAAALKRTGAPAPAIKTLMRELASTFDLRRERPGQSFRLDGNDLGQIFDFRLRDSSTSLFRLLPSPQGYVGRSEATSTQIRTAKLAGTVTQSIYKTVKDLGESPQLAVDFAEIFAWDVDFARAVQPGDELRLLYERRYQVDADGREQYLGPGRILAAQFRASVGDHTAVYFEREPGKGDYYSPDGSATQRSLLQAPLRYSRISSSFTRARFHPILKRTRPHQGIDYAAPTGTPVWAVGNGVVIYRGWGGGYGNLVKVRHEGGYVSYYAHLSRFAKGLRVGQRVSQKQVIGHVGATGLATGPHVCFRITKDGRYVDPARVSRPTADPIPARMRADFYGTRDELLAQLGTRPSFETFEAL